MSKRKELEARQQEASRKQMIQISIIIGVLAVVIIGGAIILNQTGIGGPAENAALPAPKAISRALPANADANGIGFGPADAPIKILEFVDYQCPACGAQWAANESAIVEAFSKSGKVRYEIRFLTFLEKRAGTTESTDAAMAAMCAADQGKFWDMHNSLFGNQYDENVGQFSKARLKTLATAIGLDANTFSTCLDGGTHSSRIAEFGTEADRLGVQSTPSFVIGNQIFAGGRDLAQLKADIASAIPGATID
jgi:protein-disulfide isomerase